jgi:hypothetical protein
MAKGTLDKANHEERSLNGKNNKQLWVFFVWVGGGMLSHFPFIFAPIGVYLLKNNTYKKIQADYITGGEFIWISAVFLIITMGNSITDFLSSAIKISLWRIILLYIGLFMSLICILVYFGRKGQEVPLSPATSFVLWTLSMALSVVLYKTQET